MINIDSILRDKGLSKTDVAKRMNLSRESLYRILSGNPTLDNLNKLANALDVPISYLFDEAKGNFFQCPYCGKDIEVSLTKKE